MKKSGTWLKRNIPTILSVIGISGVIATTGSSIKATLKATKLIEESEKEKGDSLSKREKISKLLPIYAPTAILGVSTIICILGSSVLNRKQQASILSAYAFINRSYKDYKIKLKELYGEEVHNNIIDSIAKAHCSDVYITAGSLGYNSTLDCTDNNEPDVTRTFYDCFSKRYFETTTSNVIQAEYHANRNFMLKGYISLNEFYEFLGLEPIDGGDDLGWSNFNGDIYWLDFDHRKFILDDGMEIYAIEMMFDPSYNYLEDL